ncbi:hypothetical protein ACTFIY_006584 [Dictyostelium cf. discoideum]
MLVAPITSIYAGILGIYYLKLLFDVIKQRRKTMTSVGDGSQILIQKIVDAGKSGKTENFSNIDYLLYDDLLKTIRSHGNFGEFVPFGLLLSLICEINGIPSILLNGVLFTFTVSRFAHVSGLHAQYSLGSGRKIGVLLTIFTLLSLSIICIYYPISKYIS